MNATLWTYTLKNLLSDAINKKEEDNLTEIEKIQKNKFSNKSRKEYFEKIIKAFCKKEDIPYTLLEVVNTTYFLEIKIETTDKWLLEDLLKDTRVLKAFAKWIWCSASRRNRYEFDKTNNNLINFKILKKEEDYDFTTKEKMKEYEIDFSKDIWLWLDPKKLSEYVWKEVKFYDDFNENPNYPRKLKIKRVFRNWEQTTWFHDAYKEWEYMIEFDKAIAINWQWVNWLFPQYILPIDNLIAYKFYKEEFVPYFWKNISDDEN